MPRILRLTFATILMTVAFPRIGASHVTFLGDSATAQSSRLRLRWSVGANSDSVEAAAPMTPGILYSGVSIDTSIAEDGSYGHVSAEFKLSLASAGDADSTAPVAYFSISAYQRGGYDTSSRSALSAGVLSLHYSSAASTIYWGIKATIYPPPFYDGGSIRAELTDPNGGRWGYPTSWYSIHGSVANSGVLPDVSALIEAYTDCACLDAGSTGIVEFGVYLDESPFSLPVLAVDPGAESHPALAARPNPASSGTRLDFVLGESGEVALSVYDCAGRRIRRLLGGTLAAGPHSTLWDGRDDRGSRVGGGLYLARLEARRISMTRRIVVLH